MSVGSQYQLTAHIASLNLSPSASPGDVIGTVTLDTSSFTCMASKTNDWVLQVIPRTSATSFAANVCTTNIAGIGVRYYDQYNGTMGCASWGSIATITGSNKTGSIPANQKLLEFVRTNDPLPAPGLYNLQTTVSLNAFNPALNSPADWGPLSISGDNTVVVSGCQMQNIVSNVDFGPVNRNSTQSKPFSLQFIGCVNDQDIQNFKKIANLIFTSPTLTTEGELGNCIANDCATGDIKISVKDFNNNLLNLNSNYPLINDPTTNLTYNFMATLTTINANAGKIEAVLNVEVNYN
ncbi:MAG TPA: hypothetical protein VGI71_23575 [Scandinavium sp.]|jgi:hypothetical protein